MLDKNDIKVLRGMFADQDERFDRKLDHLKVDVRDEMHDMEVRLVRKMTAMEHRIYGGVAELLEEHVLPQIADLQRQCKLT